MDEGCLKYDFNPDLVSALSNVLSGIALAWPNSAMTDMPLVKL